MEDGNSLVKASALAKFAAQLRAWRQRSGWSQAELAGKLLCSDSLVSGVETMSKTPTLDFAKRADQVFDLPGTFVVLHELVSREAWPSYFAPVIDFETRAVRIHEWELRVIPGLLQTEGYARPDVQGTSDQMTTETVVRLLEDPATLSAAQDDPADFVEHDGLMVIDEVQLAPELFARSRWSSTPTRGRAGSCSPARPRYWRCVSSPVRFPAGWRSSLRGRRTALVRWDAPELHYLPQDGGCDDIAYDPAGSRLAIVSQSGQVHVWEWRDDET